MTPERWNQVSDLFKAVLEKDPSEQSAFLASASGDDLELRAEVESLLAEHSRAGDFLNNPANAEAVSALRQASNDESSSPKHDPYLGMTLGNRYHIEARLARGGQALVYRARDAVVMSKPVVIKILHATAGQNAWLRKKFQQEMEVLSRIDHPGIVGVLDIGQLPDGPPFLVVQYVDGVTLRQELENGPFDPARAAAILGQIGAALAAAHTLGIAHRDLKPENVMLQQLSDGAELVKLIDFGIAKIEKPAVGNRTTTAMVAGTLRYMAPEQFQGENSSASDIYALGLIACEMLSGHTDVYALQAPRKVREQILAALATRPQDRPQKASEFSNRLAEALTKTSGEETSLRAGVLPRVRVAWLIAMLLLAGLTAAGLSYFRDRTFETRAVELSLAPPEGTIFGAFEVSPDGRQVVVVIRDSSGKSQLWVRSLASLTYQPLAGTEGADFPFWSPDSRFIAFFSEGKLRKIAASGGPPQTICDAEIGSRGGAWNREGVILFTLNPATSLYRVSAAGGEPKPVTVLDASREETSHTWPQFLPDGRSFLFLSQSAHPESSSIYAASLDSTVRKRVLATNSSALYASGHLLFQRDQTLMAQPFDTTRFQLIGEAVPVAEKVAVADATHHSLFSVSESGVLVFDSKGPGGYTQLLWYDRAGRKLGTVASRSGERAYSNVNLSPDGTRLAVDGRDKQIPNRDILIFDLARGGESRLTFDTATDASPVWSPDGNRLVFFSAREGPWNLYYKAATGQDDDKPLLKSSENKITCDWSRDGRYILFRAWDPKTKWDLWALPVEDDRKPILIVRTPFEEDCGQFSPNGRWLAYVSGEPGREEIYVESFTPGSRPTGKWQISTNGGTVPRWRRDGRELFYLGLDQKLMVAPVASDAPFQTGAPKPLFQTHAAGFLRYDVVASGQRFLVNTTIVEPTSSLPTVILNWTAALKQ
ncbi:MAG: serine/threonine-protein kinase [Acidobacteria bacterium]|nr:serine/threonine-protein kinase [Acidobacteriota bacterium]